MRHAMMAAGLLTGEFRWGEDGINCKPLKASPASLMQARAHGTQREFIRMASPLMSALALVCLIFSCSGPHRFNSGDSQWWSCSQGQPSWLQNNPLRTPSRTFVPVFDASAESSIWDFSLCRRGFRSVCSLHPVNNLVSAIDREVRIGSSAHSIEVKKCRSGSRSCVLYSSYGSVHLSPQELPPNPHFVSLVILSPLLNMAPRHRATPRRGRNLGFWGGSGGRGSSEPLRISPLATVLPSSPPSDESGPSLTSSLHSARFTFKSRLNRPLISALVTVIFSEEDDDPDSSAPASMEDSSS